MEIFVELGNSGQASGDFLMAFREALEEAKSVVRFQDLWTRDAFKESAKEVFLKMKRTVFSSG